MILGKLSKNNSTLTVGVAGPRPFLSFYGTTRRTDVRRTQLFCELLESPASVRRTGYLLVIYNEPNLLAAGFSTNFRILAWENGLIFFQNYFYSGSVYMRRVRKCTVDGRSAS